MSDQAVPFRVFFPVYTSCSGDKLHSPTLEMITRAMGFAFGGEEFVKLITDLQLGATDCTDQTKQDFERDRMAWLTFTSKAAWLEFIDRNYLQCDWGSNLETGAKPVATFLTESELATRMIQHLETVRKLFFPYDVDSARINDIATTVSAYAFLKLFRSGCYTLETLQCYFDIHDMPAEKAIVIELLDNAAHTWDKVRELKNLPGKANEYVDIDWHDPMQKLPRNVDAPIQHFLKSWADADETTVWTPGC